MCLQGAVNLAGTRVPHSFDLTLASWANVKKKEGVWRVRVMHVPPVDKNNVTLAFHIALPDVILFFGKNP